MSNYNTELQGNNAALEEILMMAKNLPAGSLESRLSLGFHTDELLYIFVDGKPAGAGIELPKGGIPGYVDEENNVVIMGLPDGDYTVKYEMEDGSTVDIGALEVGGAEPEEPNYFDAATALLNHRIGSSGSPSAYNGMVTTDFIEITSDMAGKRFVVGGCDVVQSSAYSYFGRYAYYDASKVFIDGYNPPAQSEIIDSGIPADMFEAAKFVRISLVIKDNVEITADDVANLRITLE